MVSTHPCPTTTATVAEVAIPELFTGAARTDPSGVFRRAVCVVGVGVTARSPRPAGPE
jgi:hypothetical protein